MATMFSQAVLNARVGVLGARVDKFQMTPQQARIRVARAAAGMQFSTNAVANRQAYRNVRAALRQGASPGQVATNMQRLADSGNTVAFRATQRAFRVAGLTISKGRFSGVVNATPGGRAGYTPGE